MTTVQEAPLEAPLALSDRAARQLANATKTVPQMLTITPRWLVHLLPWSPVEAGIYPPEQGQASRGRRRRLPAAG